MVTSSAHARLRRTPAPHIVLVSCVKTKRAERCAARDLYTSALFRGLRAYAERRSDAWFVLSAEHGLVAPDRVVAPYERTLNRMGKTARAAWSERVCAQLAAALPESAIVTVLAGVRYREGLVPFLHARNHAVRVPMEGLALGAQLRWLKDAARAAHAT